MMLYKYEILRDKITEDLQVLYNKLYKTGEKN